MMLKCHRIDWLAPSTCLFLENWSQAILEKTTNIPCYFMKVSLSRPRGFISFRGEILPPGKTGENRGKNMSMQEQWPGVADIKRNLSGHSGLAAGQACPRGNM